MSKRQIYLFSIICTLLWTFCDSYYTLQVGCFSDRMNAETLKLQMEELLLTPVTISDVNGLSKVFAGQFDSYLEAKYINDNLKSKAIVNGGFIKQMEKYAVKGLPKGETTKCAAFELFNLQKEAREAAAFPKAMKAPKSLGLSNAEILAAPNETLTEDQLHRKIKLLYLQTSQTKGTRYLGGRSPLGVLKSYIEENRNTENTLLQHANVMLGINAMHDKSYKAARILLTDAVENRRNSSWGMYGMYQLGLLDIRENKREKAFETFEEMIHTNPNHATAGLAAIRLGYVKLGNNDKRMAKEYFRRVAAGEVNASKTDRIEAMQSFAKIAHNQRDLVTAYKAFDELSAYTDPGDEKLRIELEKAGLLLEGALCEKGSYADCRTQCEKVLQLTVTDSANLKYRARAALMYIESLNYEKNYEASIIAINLYREEFTACTMEYEAMTYWLGENYYAQKQYSQAQNTFASVYDSGTAYTETFKAFNPKLSSLFSAAMAYRRTKDMTHYHSLLQRIVTDYPDTKEGHLAKARLQR